MLKKFCKMNVFKYLSNAQTTHYLLYVEPQIPNPTHQLTQHNTTYIYDDLPKMPSRSREQTTHW